MKETKFLKLKELLAENTQNLFVIFGSDSYVRRKAVEQIESSLKLSLLEFNKVVMENPNMTAIEEAALVSPVMSKNRLVVVNDYNYTGKIDTMEKEKLSVLQDRLGDTFLLFNSEKLSSVLAEVEGAVYVDCNTLDTPTLIKWVMAKARTFGKSISADSARLLCDSCMGDMGRISTETEKLSLLCDEVITKEDVDDNVAKDSEFAIFALAEQISNKQADESFLIMKKLLLQGNTANAIVNSIYRHYRRMFFVRTSGLGQDDLAKMLAVKNYAVVKSRQAAERFTPIRLKNAVDICAKHDNEVRNNADGAFVLNKLVLNLLEV